MNNFLREKLYEVHNCSDGFNDEQKENYIALFSKESVEIQQHVKKELYK